jgi:hypothetical protein
VEKKMRVKTQDGQMSKWFKPIDLRSRVNSETLAEIAAHLALDIPDELVVYSGNGSIRYFFGNPEIDHGHADTLQEGIILKAYGGDIGQVIEGANSQIRADCQFNRLGGRTLQEFTLDEYAKVDPEGMNHRVKYPTSTSGVRLYRMK